MALFSTAGNDSSIIDPTKMAISQNEFIQICNKGLQSQMTVGAIVQLNNQYGWKYQVIGTNHDSTTGTVDLMAYEQVGKMAFGSTHDYNSSTVRTWINGTYKEAFDASIQNLMQAMEVTTMGTTQNDKVKLLSWKELGVTSASNLDSTDGGTQYSIFTAGDQSTAILDRWRERGLYGNDSYLWTRSRQATQTNRNILVRRDGTVDHDPCSSTLGVLPVMRF